MGQSSPDPTAMQGIDSGWAMPPSFLVMLLHGNVGESGDCWTPEPVHTMSVLSACRPNYSRNVSADLLLMIAGW